MYAYETKIDHLPVHISLEEHDKKGTYTANAEGLDGLAEMTYSRASPTLIILDHTGVDESLRGQDMGKLLAQYVVMDARQKGQKIVPLCPFFKAQVERHPEWADVLK